MSVLIGHAAGDENGGAHGGQAGDQTGREVYTRNWYNSGWNVVLRPKTAKVAELSARFCEQACANSNIGYDQYQRNTLRTEARKVNWNASAIQTPCETDCSQLMTTCAEAAGVDFSAWYASTSNAPTTWTMRRAFFETGAYDILLDRKYTDSSDYLLRGDILVRESGHTAMALSNGSKATPREYTEKNESEDNEMAEPRYNSIAEIPEWGKETVSKLCDGGIIRGYGSAPDGDGRPTDMNLSEDMIRMLVWNDRAGMYGKI